MHEPFPAETPAVPPSPSTEAVAPWWHTALLILLLVGVSFLNARQAGSGGLATHHAQRYAASILAEWVLFLLTWWGLSMQRVSIREVIGFRPGLRAWMQDLGAGLVFWIAAVIVLAIVSLSLRLAHLSSAQRAIAELAPRNAGEMLLWIGLSVSAGFCEEFLFRGYFLRQFSSPIHRLWLGVVVSSLLFGISHGYEGAAGMIAISVYGALFCALAILRRSLRPGMIAHAWHDIFTGAALVLLRHARLP